MSSAVQTYEIAFAGEAGEVLQAEFDDCQVFVGPGVTTLRADVPDPAALASLMQRLAALRLELLYANRVPSRPSAGTEPAHRGLGRSGPD